MEVEVNGLGEVLAVRIDPSLVEKQDREMIEDLLPAAFNAAQQKAKQLARRGDAVDHRRHAAARVAGRAVAVHGQSARAATASSRNSSRGAQFAFAESRSLHMRGRGRSASSSLRPPEGRTTSTVAATSPRRETFLAPLVRSEARIEGVDLTSFAHQRYAT